MAILDDNLLERLRELNALRDRAIDLRERGHKALARIPSTVQVEKLKEDHDLSGEQWVSGSHPVDLALVVRVLNNQGLRGDDFEPCCDAFHNSLSAVIESIFARNSCIDRKPRRSSNDPMSVIETGDDRGQKNPALDPVPVLTAARAMHALMGKSQTVFSTATMLCYYQIVRELYLATFPNWIIGAARAGEGGRVSAFVTGECVRAVLAFQNSIQDTITFFVTTKTLHQKLERLRAIPDIDSHLKPAPPSSHWKECKQAEVERVVLDWYAANNLRRNTIALNLSSAANAQPAEPVRIGRESAASAPANASALSGQASVFPIDGGRIDLASIEKMLKTLTGLLMNATKEAVGNIAAARDAILELRKSEAGRLQSSDIKNLDFLVKVLLNDPENNYEYYRKALGDQTKQSLNAYAGTTPHTETQRVKGDALKELLVRDLNKNFEKHLVAHSEDWQELKNRTDGKTTRKLSSKETEWLVERHLGVIKLMQEKGKWEGASELIQLNRIFLEDAFCKTKRDPTTSVFNRVDRHRFDATSSAHTLALRVVGEALDEAERAAARMATQDKPPAENLPAILDDFIKQYGDIYKRIGRVIDPAKRYIQDVLNRELAHVANSAKFDAGELLFAAASFGAITKWKQNKQLMEARRLLVELLPEDGKFQTNRPIQSDLKGLQLMPIAFEMTRCFAQLMRKDFGEDLDPKVVRKLLNLFEENPIHLSQDADDRIGWNFSGAPESQKPSVWVTAVGVFALDRMVRMLNERINAMVLRNFNVEWPNAELEPGSAVTQPSGGKLDLSGLISTDYELQSAFVESKKLAAKYKKTPHRLDNVSLAIRLQQMRAHLTRAVLPTQYSRRSPERKYRKAYNAIFYGPPGTGKTTLAEALATSAGVPLVRLSPSDLMVQGTDVIESRARAIFDSLSMLTQAVIFLDEFEPVVRTREIKSKKAGAAVPQDPPEFRFLVTGMLPKLTKLNKVAAKQSVVYLMATNYLSEIDDAAKRYDRFDLHLPIYHPDPMSRALTFFYGLIKVLENKSVVLENKGVSTWRDSLANKEKSDEFWKRVWEAIDLTEEVSVQSLATLFFSPEQQKSFFPYVLEEDGTKCPAPTPEQGSKDAQQTPVEGDVQLQRMSYEVSWHARKPV